MDSTLFTVALPLGLAVIMFGLGMSLTLDDFRRIALYPRAVAVALICQVLLMPLVAFGLVVALGVGGELAVGVMLLAAAPGGTMANLFSHLFGGDLALNITLTAINSALAIVTVPITAQLALDHFLAGKRSDVGLRFDNLAPVLVLVVVPVAAGMLLRHHNRAFADRMDHRVRIASFCFVGLLVTLAILQERTRIGGYLVDTGLVDALFAVASLSAGFALPRLAGIPERQAIACAFEIGLHNSVFAIVIATSVLDNSTMAVPASMYAIIVWLPALLLGLTLGRRTRISSRREHLPATP